MASALVSPISDVLPLRVMNLSDTTQKLYRETNAAVGEIAETIYPVEKPPTNAPPPEVRSAKQVDVNDLPEHLRPVWQNSVDNLDENQKKDFL